jgi:hypothetical protein
MSSYGANGLTFVIRTFTLPLWLLFVAFAGTALLLPGVRLVRRALVARHRRRPERRGFAPICSDDVRGTSDRCQEFEAVPTPQAASLPRPQG